MNGKLTWTHAGLALSVALAAILLLPVNPKSPPPATACLSSVKQLVLSHHLYGSEFDERLPSALVWMDAIFPYGKNEHLFHCPREETRSARSYGYAFNSDLHLAHLQGVSEPEKVPMVYDSVSFWRNATDAFASLPPEGRHRGRNSIGYADGHARRVPAAP
jgi:prepilin-type processing-associated H-X9-DG protein